jgi:phage shock protein A
MFSSMFEDLQRLFKESLTAFRTELQKREPEDEIAHLLGSMRRELVEARALLPKLQEQLNGARAALVQEREQLERTERRGRMALQIRDTETTRIAEEFSAKHRERIAVLEQKVAAAEAELALRSREAEEMKQQYQEADSNRMELVARLRHARSHGRIRSVADEAADSFSEWDRMTEKMESGTAYADALRELDEDGSPPPAESPPLDVEERLRELKRRMGKG